MLLNIGN